MGALLIAWIILRLKGLIFPGLRGPKTVLGHNVEPQGCGVDFKVPCFGVELRELAPVLSASEQPERKTTCESLQIMKDCTTVIGCLSVMPRLVFPCFKGKAHDRST